jgi:hypothetical protein
MLKATIALMTLALAACIHDQTVAVAAEAPPKPPAPEVGYVKGPGASPEDFRSTSADCKKRAEIGKSDGNDPIGFYRNCMRAEGWLEVPRRFLYQRPRY